MEDTEKQFEINSPEPMDEFEYKQKLRPKLNIKILITIIGSVLVGIIIFALFYIILNQPITPNSQVTNTPVATEATATPLPENLYPSEYKAIHTQIDDYSKDVGQVQNTRNKLRFPNLDFRVKF